MSDPGNFDSWRIYHLYQYLFGRLAISRKPDGSANISNIAARIGNKNLRRTVTSLFAQERQWKGTIEKSNTVTTGSVVKMLSELRKSLADDYRQGDEPYSRVLNAEDILVALYKIIELTPEELRQLDLPKGDELTLLRQMLLTLRAAGDIEHYEAVFNAYKAAVGLDSSASVAPLNTLSDIDQLIAQTTVQALDYLPEKLSRQKNGKIISHGKQDTIKGLTIKAQEDVRRLLIRSGNTSQFLPDSTTEHPYIRRYLQPAFIKKLTHTVINNARLNEQFPIYLKRITIEARGPLPLAEKTSRYFDTDVSYLPLLNSVLKQFDRKQIGSTDDLPGPSDYELASQESVKISAEFYLKVPADYKCAVKEIFDQFASNHTRLNNTHRRVDFTLTSTGIGGTLSHVVKIINLMLLSDIPCLSSFFPIAHDVTSTQQIIRDNVPSPVWAHSLVQLCYNETVGEALQAFDSGTSPYQDMSFGEPIGYGDFCGFDFLLSQAQASLQARLQAVRNTGIRPEEYVHQLCQRTEKLLILDRAWSYLRRYPFSSMVMIGTLHRTLIGDIFRKRSLTKEDSYICFDAYLSIAEALLDEGAYRASYDYLRDLSVLETYVQQGLDVNKSSKSSSPQTFEIFSGSLIVRYLICVANYYYLYDREDDADCRYLLLDCTSDINRQVLIQKAWAKLREAQQHIEVRLKKYIVIREPSQGTFSPHYELLGRIYFARAKLLMFFSRFVPPVDRSALPTENFVGQQRTAASACWGRLYLMEKARLYAAADGNSEVYACYSAMQSYLYMVAAYAQPEDLTLYDTETTLTRPGCLKLAERLRDHALLTYAETGRQCYYDIKEKSGLPKEVDHYSFGEEGRCSIEKIPAIFEVRGGDLAYQNGIGENVKVLTLDISLLGVHIEDLPKLTPKHPTQNVYLFGANACYLFFARGLYLLCSDTTDEFKQSEDCKPIQWERKLNKAMRLLNMAWAIAEDGCLFTREKESDKNNHQSTCRITRSFSDETDADLYTSLEISSVRDLYPRRVSEIADLGKVFAAACMVLRLYTASPEQQVHLAVDIQKIVNMLHGGYRLKETLKELLQCQNRYNGSLKEHLASAREIIERYANSSFENRLDAAGIHQLRDQLMADLFKGLSGFSGY